MHMAAAVGVPVVALFGPTNPKNWGPWTERKWVLSPPCLCNETKREACDWSQVRACLASITVAEAQAALDQMLTLCLTKTGMSIPLSFLDLLALSLRPGRHPRPPPETNAPRILVIRRNRLGDMIYTLPHLHALRKHYPRAHLAVACDPPGAPIARACAAVDEVILLDPGWNPWQAALKNGARLQDYDWVIAAKGGFDRRLATLARLTNAPVRIGFETKNPSRFYTDPVPPPAHPHEEHQIETLLRLLQALRPSRPEAEAVDLRPHCSAASREFADAVLARPPFAPTRRFILINLSSTVPLKFRDDDFAGLAGRILASTDLVIGLVAAPADQPKAVALAARIASGRVTAVATPGPLDLAALLARAHCLLTPEGGAAHLAAAVNAPSLVFGPKARSKSGTRAEPAMPSSTPKGWNRSSPSTASGRRSNRSWKKRPSPEPAFPFDPAQKQQLMESQFQFHQSSSERFAAHEFLKLIVFTLSIRYLQKKPNLHIALISTSRDSLWLNASVRKGNTSNAFARPRLH